MARGATMSKTPARTKRLAERNAKILDLLDATTKDGQRRYRQCDVAAKFGLTQGAISQLANNPNCTTYYE